MCSPSGFFHNKLYLTQNNFGPLNDHMITQFSSLVTIITGRDQRWHFAATRNVTVAIVETIVIVVYLPYQIAHNYFRALWYKRVSKMTQLANSGFLAAKIDSIQPNSKLYIQKIITYPPGRTCPLGMEAKYRKTLLYSSLMVKKSERR